MLSPPFMQMQPHNSFCCRSQFTLPMNTVLSCEDSNELNYNESTYLLCSISKDPGIQSVSDKGWLIRRLDSLTL